MNNKETADKIVTRMLETINQGKPLPWVKPWKGTMGMVEVLDGFTTITITPKFWNRKGTPYSGINTLLLGLSGKEGEFITFKQCQSEGGKVKKGAKGSTIVYWNQLVKEELDPVTGEKKKVNIPILKTYTVFNVEEDCENIRPKHRPEPQTIQIPQYHWEPEDGEEDDDDHDERIPEAEAIIADYIRRAKTLVLHRDNYSDEAFYAPALDSVTVPKLSQFKAKEEFYSTLFHELGHSTGHSSRLNRFTGKGSASFGSENYSREELIAEITSATILSMLGMETGNSFRNSTAYVKGWSEHIKNDPMMFVTASSRADKAIDMILGINTEDCDKED